MPVKSKIKTKKPTSRAKSHGIQNVVPTDSNQDLSLEIKPEAAPNESDVEGEKLTVKPDETEQDTGSKEKYFETVGRRKESIARIRLMTKKSTDTTQEDRALLTVNGKSYDQYFHDTNLLARIEAPLRKLKSLQRFKASVVVYGGGISGQADAIRHGIARALEKFDNNFRKKLKKAGFLTRDPRIKERRKYGHKKARKSGRWSKR